MGSPPPGAGRWLALTGGLIHPLTGEPPATGTLLLRGDAGGTVHGRYPSLAAARAAAEAVSPAGEFEVIDVSGLAVLPGMVDCHVHLFFDGGLDMTSGQSRDPGLAAARAGEYLRAGVTTVRDLGAPVPEVLTLRDAIATGTVTGPRVLAAGPIVTVPGGHGGFVGEVVEDGAALPAAVERLADRGVDCIKIAVSGGVSTPGSDLFAVQFSEDDLRAGVAAAHRRGLRVAAHASNPASVRIAADAGVDSVEHAVMLDQPALTALRRGTTVLVPTLAATDKPLDFLADPAIPGFLREKARITLPAHRDSIRRAIAAGVPVAGGTDGGSTATGHGLTAAEAVQLVACGLSGWEAVAAVTRDAARLLGLGDRLGTLATGAAADVVVLGGDPVTDIGRLRDVRLVVKGGVVVHRAPG